MQGFGNNTLVVRKVERTDVGHYKCVASNYLGRVSSEAMVNVNGNGSSITRSVHGACILVQELTFVFSPPGDHKRVSRPDREDGRYR